MLFSKAFIGIVFEDINSLFNTIKICSIAHHVLNFLHNYFNNQTKLSVDQSKFLYYLQNYFLSILILRHCVNVFLLSVFFQFKSERSER